MSKKNKSEKKIILEAVSRFKHCNDAESEVRKESAEDLRFRVGQQWDTKLLGDRLAQERPCLSINRIPQFIKQITNEQRMNRPQIRIVATDEQTQEIAKVREGMIRQIQVKSNADVAYDIACDYQVTMGFGYIRVGTKYCDDKSFEQEIEILPVHNPFSVFFDPNAREVDYSDAEYCFVAEYVSKSEFKRLYGDVGKSDNDEDGVGSDSQFMPDKDLVATWVTDNSVLVCEYFVVEKSNKKIYLLSSGETVDKLPEGITEDDVEKTRIVENKKVKWYKICFDKILDEGEWPSEYIPIVPVLGDDYTIDGHRYLYGLTRFMRDPQRMYNYWNSAQAEAIALAPKAPFIVAEGQIEGYRQFWENANRATYAYLPYKPITVGGVLVGEPRRVTAEPAIQAITHAIVQSNEDLKNVTGIHDASLGVRSNETSGRAIMARQKEGDVANFNFQDNLARALNRVGVIINDLIPKIYDTERVIRILHANEEAEIVTINAMFGDDKSYDITQGNYDVTVTTGASYATKRQETADNIINISQSNPAIWQWAADILFKNLDINGSDELAERAKAMLPPQIQSLANKKDGAQIPPEIQQKMAQYEQVIDQLTAALHKEKDISDAKELELQSNERIAAANNETKILIESMKHNFGVFKEELLHVRESLNRLQNNQNIETEQKESIDNANRELL